MSFVTQGKTNWKFLLIIIVLSVIIGGGIFWFLHQQIQPYQPIAPAATCIPEGGTYGAPLNKNDLCCTGLVEQPTSKSGTIGICVKPTDETAGWQTYTNNNYGFEFEYPKQYNLSIGSCSNGYIYFDSDCVSVTDSGNSECNVNFANANSAEYQECLTAFGTSSSWASTVFAGQKVIVWPQINGLPYVNYCIQKNDKYYVIFEKTPYISPNRNPQEPLPAGCSQTLFDQILSSFQFLK